MIFSFPEMDEELPTAPRNFDIKGLQFFFIQYRL